MERIHDFTRQIFVNQNTKMLSWPAVKCFEIVFWFCEWSALDTLKQKVQETWGEPEQSISLCWHQIWNASSEPYKNCLLAFVILIRLLSMSTLLWNLPACQLSQFPVERSFFVSLHNNCLRGDIWSHYTMKLALIATLHKETLPLFNFMKWFYS